MYKPTYPNEMLLEIKTDYLSGMLMKEIAFKKSINIATVGRILRFLGVKTIKPNKRSKKYNLNENYFKVIDTPEKAYWLGFIYADGNIHIRENNSAHIFNINLKEDDCYIIEKLIHSVGYTGNIFTKKYIGTHYKDAKGVNICNKEFCLNLINKGVSPKKSLILKFPTKDQVPEVFLPHFIRGYFDGDGCVYFKNKSKKSCAVTIIGTEDMLNGISNFLKKNGINSNIRKNKNIFIINIYSMSNIFDLFELLYKDSKDFKLNRKYEIFVKSFEKIGFYKITKDNKQYIIHNLWTAGKNFGKYHGFFKDLLLNEVKKTDGWKIEKLLF